MIHADVRFRYLSGIENVGSEQALGASQMKKHSQTVRALAFERAAEWLARKHHPMRFQMYARYRVIALRQPADIPEWKCGDIVFVYR